MLPDFSDKKNFDTLIIYLRVMLLQAVHCLTTLLRYWWWFIWIAAIVGIAFTFLDVSLGVRRAYISTLLVVFEWVTGLSAKRGIYAEDDIGDGDKARKSSRLQRRAITKHISSSPLLDYSSKRAQEDMELRNSMKNDNRFAATFDDISLCTRWGLEAIVTDEFTECTRVAELPMWNLLTRTSYDYRRSPKLAVAWLVGALIRYGILLPVRMICFCTGILYIYIMAGYCIAMRDDSYEVKRRININFFRLLAKCLSLTCNYHNLENVPQLGGVCVSNHTTPVDMVVLGRHSYYCLVGQTHHGLLGLMERGLCAVSDHIYFDRAQMKDREFVKAKMKDHVARKMPPINIFPEAVCVNNTAILQFRKGPFELDATVYPVAIKYDRRFGEAFWWQDDWAPYQFDLMTSWAMIADVYFLPPMRRFQDESSIDFAQRVKEAIALEGGFISVNFEGMLKYKPVQPNLLEAAREVYGNRLKANGLMDEE